MAWAPTRGIARVEVQVDDGDWQECRLGDVASDNTWVQWLYEWDAPPGDHVLTVRATDGDGVTQTSDIAPPIPDGATGWHSRRVHVDGSTWGTAALPGVLTEPLLSFGIGRGCVDTRNDRTERGRVRSYARMTGFRVTYATLSADDDELHAAYDAALADAKSTFGERHPLRIGSERRAGAATFETVSPGRPRRRDRRVRRRHGQGRRRRRGRRRGGVAGVGGRRRGPNGWRSSTAPPT